MHFTEALRIAAHRTGLARRPDARPSLLAVPIALGAVLMVMSLFEPLFFVVGAGLWLYGAGAVIAGSIAAKRPKRLPGRFEARQPGVRAS